MSDSTPKKEEEIVDELGLEELPPVDAETPTTPETAGKSTQSLPESGVPTLTREILDGNLDQPVELTDFMFKLGLHYDLPGKAETTLEAPAFLKKRGTRIWLVVLAVMVTALGGVAPVLARPKPVTSLPPEVLGEWSTSLPRYAGRKLILSAERVRIDFGDHAAAVEFPISEVRRRETQDGVQYEVLYRQDRGLTQFVFSFTESTWPASITLPNPEGVDWVRAKDVEAIKAEERRAAQVRSRGRTRLP
jgi:hypothetical protein